jgi:Sodium/calcium exchanger protein
MLAKT